MNAIRLRTANLADPTDRQLLVSLTDAYARDAMGGGVGFSATRQQQLANALASHPALFALIAEQDGHAVGHALCVLGFSSFYAAAVCNVHDLSVMSSARGQGLGRLLMQGIEAAARERDCAKITLEVREDNHVGRKLYASTGFAQSGMGNTPYLLLEKALREKTL